MLPREVRLFRDMGDIDGHVVRAQRAHVWAGDVTIECVHGPMPSDWHEGHLILPQWTAVDDRGNVYRATSGGSARSIDGARTSVDITFRGVDVEAQWLDVNVRGYDGRPVLGIRVPFTGGGGEATVPAIPVGPSPRGPELAQMAVPEDDEPSSKVTDAVGVDHSAREVVSEPPWDAAPNNPSSDTD